MRLSRAASAAGSRTPRPGFTMVLSTPTGPVGAA
ncbi:hypothetical protein HNR40_010783 [Nonomuraea endophytica]|uniref:Uncharacterized protein n=1 Tax=Nonomuraea endophytica TaxID=714136 RepID=A0A7W8EMQ7_9ACTN|nr:hypothetical protein [Nonomuraea endophytica]